MLLIAQPKSWSSALMEYMKVTHKIPVKQVNLSSMGLIRPIEFNPIAQLHCCCVDLTEARLDALVNSIMFHRQHCPPTDNNLRLLEKHKDKVLILLRKPIESVFAYWRAIRKKIHDDSIHYRSEELFYSLERFYNKYKKSGLNVIEAPLDKLKINQAERFFGFKETENPELPKVKYSR